MIHVCSLARLHETVDSVGARHVVTLLRNTDQVIRPDKVLREHHLILSMDDICMPLEGYELPGEAHVTRLIEFVTGWDRAAPMVVHCYAGISRSTAAAFTAACAVNPGRNEEDIALALRRASPIATPNARIVELADKALGRNGRMVRAIAGIGLGQSAIEGNPFRLDLE
jgi:predicted protein tyrosine phosphatase